MSDSLSADLVILQATPGGIMAAVAAAREGRSVLLVERTAHIGGLPANGLGATDVGRRKTTGGLFDEFRERVIRHYVETCGENSQQVRDADDGHHFEPSVAERVFETMLSELADRVTVLREHQFDFQPEDVQMDGKKVEAIRVMDRNTGSERWLNGQMFIDASYEGDLATAAGVPFRLGRESKDDFGEPMAGTIYEAWYEGHGSEHTGEGDERIQAYNYRMCLTRDPKKRIRILKPDGYRREEYISLIKDVIENRWAGRRSGEKELDGIGRVVNMVMLPNGKTDANNQHLSWLSTDLPEENYPWPTANWEWRDGFVKRLRDYTLGLLWFVQNDHELPLRFRERCREWGLAADEYQDSENFPRQVYVREGRRIAGDYLFTAHDSLPQQKGGRPPVHQDGITASHYPLDSHATRKRESGKCHLEGFFSLRNKPYTVPYRIMVNREFPNLLFPVPVSGTHVGFSTLRMEPCWMALGQAAGVAAHQALEADVDTAKVDTATLQQRLLNQGSILLVFADFQPGEPGWNSLQLSAMRGSHVSQNWWAEPDQRADETFRNELAELWGLQASSFPTEATRRDLWILVGDKS